MADASGFRRTGFLSAHLLRKPLSRWYVASFFSKRCVGSSPPPSPEKSAVKDPNQVDNKEDGIKGGMGDAAWEDEDDEDEEEEEDDEDDEGEAKTDDELWAASTEDKAEEVVTEEDRNRWDATGLETKSGHVWMSDEQTKDPEWGENMDQAEMDWAEALARESIEKQDDPLLTLTLTLTLT